jgi:hypothetical protein
MGEAPRCLVQPCFGQGERTGFRNVSVGPEKRRPSQNQADENSHDSGPPALAHDVP